MKSYLRKEFHGVPKRCVNLRKNIMQQQAHHQTNATSASSAAPPRLWQSKHEWEVLVENIAQSHARLASGIQMAIEKQWGNKFSASLQAYAATKENQIREVCSTNYQEFVDSIEEIVRMKSDVANLQKDIEKFQSELIGASSSVLSAYDSLAACYDVQQNIDESIEKLQQCQRIVGLATTIDSYITQDKLFHALKVLEELRAEIACFRGQLFPQRMNEWMHATLESIKDEAKRNVSTWLEDIRAESLSIGEFAVKRFENQLNEQYYEQDILEKCGMRSNNNTGGSQRSYASNSISSLQKPSVDEIIKLPSLKVLNSDADLLRVKTSIHSGYMKKTMEKISPMLRILHVFRVMNQVPELAAFYNANRLPQLHLPSFLTGDVAMITPEKFVSQHDILFKKLTGAFCLEHLLWRYSNEALLTKKEINGIFHLIVQSLCGIVSASIIRIESPNIILDIKKNAVMCARALGDEVHEYNTGSIFDTFRKLGAHFRHTILADTKRQLKQFMSTDNFQPYKFGRRELGGILDLLGLDQEDNLLKGVDMTTEIISMPFTEVVVKSCRAIETLVQMMYEYEKYLNINEWGDAVRDDAIEALVYLNEVLNELIDEKSDLQVSMVVIMGVNASYLAFACERIDTLVKQQTEIWEQRTYGYSVNTLSKSHALSKPCSSRLLGSRAGAKKKFDTSTTRAQDMVCELMIKKIDDLISSFYFVNWVPSEVSLQPDPAMWDLINYLKVTFAQLSQLPIVVKEAIHFASCIHISKALEQILCGKDVKKVTMAGIANFKRNLDALIDFIGSCGVTQLKECFLALLQLVELLVSGEAEKFMDPQQREAGRYSHLSVDNVSVVLDKLKETKSTASKLWGGGLKSHISAASSPSGSSAPVKKGIFRRG